MKCFKTLDLTILSQTDKLDDFRMFDFGCYMQTLLMCAGTGGSEVGGEFKAKRSWV